VRGCNLEWEVENVEGETKEGRDGKKNRGVQRDNKSDRERSFQKLALSCMCERFICFLMGDCVFNQESNRTLLYILTGPKLADSGFYLVLCYSETVFRNIKYR